MAFTISGELTAGNWSFRLTQLQALSESASAVSFSFDQLPALGCQLQLQPKLKLRLKAVGWRLYLAEADR
jgi:hypothetical protein